MTNRLAYPLLCAAMVAATLAPALALDKTEQAVARLAVPIFQNKYCGEPIVIAEIHRLATAVMWEANVRPADAIEAATRMSDRFAPDAIRKGKLEAFCAALKSEFQPGR